VREVAGSWALAAPVLLAPDARAAVDRARAVVDRLVADDKVSYAITTGVGKLSDVRIVGEQIRELQLNLVRSHAVGVGEPLAVSETRAMMLPSCQLPGEGPLRCARRHIDTICEMLNPRCHANSYHRREAWAASGDLAPLAHLALALIGEGECFDDKGARIPSAEALKRAQIKPLVLEAKEAVSLINGTPGHAGSRHAVFASCRTLVDTADVIGAMACDAFKGH